MSKRIRVKNKSHRETPALWLPIDSRLFTKFFSFGHVKGLSRVFLEVEIALSILVVFGTVLFLLLTLFGFIF
ncbi:hypothetical protein HY409_02135 [Candidatus Gottesmanbacteria bacterium]|nr:hypothetical protein [Candidatus Gottesmanbacteria bacterium]